MRIHPRANSKQEAAHFFSPSITPHWKKGFGLRVKESERSPGGALFDTYNKSSSLIFPVSHRSFCALFSNNPHPGTGLWLMTDRTKSSVGVRRRSRLLSCPVACSFAFFSDVLFCVSAQWRKQSAAGRGNRRRRLDAVAVVVACPDYYYC